MGLNMYENKSISDIKINNRLVILLKKVLLNFFTKKSLRITEIFGFKFILTSSYVDVYRFAIDGARHGIRFEAVAAKI